MRHSSKEFFKINNIKEKKTVYIDVRQMVPLASPTEQIVPSYGPEEKLYFKIKINLTYV